MKLQCSLQLFRYLRARRAGCPTESAAAQAGIGLAEARLHDEAQRAGEYDHIDTTEMPLIASHNPTEPADQIDQRSASRVNACGEGQGLRSAMVDPGSPEPKEEDMARGRRKAADEVVEIKKPDFELAKRIYFNDIKPAKSKQATHGQELSTAYKEIKAQAHIQPQAAKLAFQLAEMEESKRDDFLRSLRGLLTTFRIFIPADLVDQAEGKQGDSNVIPIGESPRPSLATIPNDDSDLAADDWAASLKEGDLVLVPVGEKGEGKFARATITFADGDALDVEYLDDGETIKATVPRASVSAPETDDGEHLEAAE
jgi:hypothetical protein